MKDARMPKRPTKSGAGENFEEEWKPRGDEALGAYIRRIRLMRGLNLPDVARATATLPPTHRVSHPYLSQIELGQVFHPSRERLQSIANVLGIPEAWLLEKAGLSSGDAEQSTQVARSPLVDQIAMRAAQLQPADQKLFLQMIEAIVRMRRGESKGSRR
jgi:transcriptional regulator with XRE-family HTH domain